MRADPRARWWTRPDDMPKLGLSSGKSQHDIPMNRWIGCFRLNGGKIGSVLDDKFGVLSLIPGKFWLRALVAARALPKAPSTPSETAHPLQEAIAKCLDGARKRFDETVELCVRLNLDPRKPEHNLRGLVRLPAGVPKVPRVAVFTTLTSEAAAAQAHGAEFVGAEELVEHIQKHGVTFDRCLATPEALPYVSRVAKILGPRGLVPSEKLGTVGVDIGDLVEISRNSVQFRTDPYGQIHLPVAKVSFGADRIRDNVWVVVHHLLRLKPDSVRRRYLLGATLSRTQGPGVEVAISSFATS
jgi:large subunit ribosomal protein L1